METIDLFNASKTNGSHRHHYSYIITTSIFQNLKNSLNNISEFCKKNCNFGRTKLSDKEKSFT
jgi:hypothetical protein